MTSNDYNILSDVMKSLNRIEDKLDEKIDKLDDRTTKLEHFQHNLMGKIGIGVIIVGSAVTFIIELILEWFKRR